MTDKKDQRIDGAELRRLAEDQLRKKTGAVSPTTGTEEEPLRHLHELQVHQIELEMQNAELCQARDEAETALEKYSDLYDFAPVGYFTLDRDKIICGANFTGASLLGIERSRLIGRCLGLCVADEARPAFTAFLEKVFTSQSKVACEVMLLKEGSEPHCLHVEGRASASGKECRLVLIDITERKRAEEALKESESQLKQQKMMLEELNSTLEKRVQEEVTKNREKDIVLIQQNRMAALGEMFDHIAHQWKQPLNTIAVIIQALGSTSAQEQVTTKDILETVDSTMDMVAHMAQTVDVFRNFYKPDKERSAFLVKDSIDKALTFVMPVFMRFGIEVDLDADDQLLAFGYPKEYAQVLHNILANAKDALRERGVKNPRINIRAFADGDNTVVSITDNAGGIPAGNLERIFDLNFTTKESSGGNGIGLYMSRNIIEKNMGGRLTVRNYDNGAQFRIELGKS